MVGEGGEGGRDRRCFSRREKGVTILGLSTCRQPRSAQFADGVRDAAVRRGQTSASREEKGRNA